MGLKVNYALCEYPALSELVVKQCGGEYRFVDIYEQILVDGMTNISLFAGWVTPVSRKAFVVRNKEVISQFFESIVSGGKPFVMSGVDLFNEQTIEDCRKLIEYPSNVLHVENFLGWVVYSVSADLFLSGGLSWH